MSTSYHNIDETFLRFAVAFIVAKKGKTLQSVALSNLKVADGKRQLIVKPAMRGRTFMDGMRQVEQQLQSMSLSPVRGTGGDSIDQAVAIEKLWQCRCTETDPQSGKAFYKIRKRSIVDKCFVCGAEEGRSISPDAVQGAAYLKGIERKEREIKRGGSW